MKKQLLLWPLLTLAAPVAAQHTELQARAGVGLFRFGGPNAQSSSFVNYSDFPDLSSYTNSPYGSRWGTGLALGGRVESVGSHNGLIAMDLGYERLQSRTNITALWVSSFRNGSSNSRFFDASGSTALQTHNLTAFFGLGHRFAAGKFSADALVGPEAAYLFSFREKGSGNYDGTAAWRIDHDLLGTRRADVRLRADATVWYGRLGLNASYSHGFLNYQTGLLGAGPEVYARVLRLGVVGRLL